MIASRSDAARRLIRLAHDSQASGIARRALLLRLSALPRHRDHPHHLRLAREVLLPLHDAERAEFYELANADIAVVWRGEAPVLQTCLDALNHLFAGEAPPAELLDLPVQADILREAAEDSLVPPADDGDVSPRAGPPLDLATLASLEPAVSQINLDRFVRRRPVCVADGDGFRLAWQHRFLLLDELADTMVPGRDPAADPWLRRRLEHHLQRRMLSLLCAPEELREVAPFSLDQRVAGILAPEFLRFDAVLPAVLRGHVVLNLDPADLLADPDLTLFACGVARNRDYRLLLAGALPAHLALLPPERVGLDLVELRWSPDLVASGLALPDPGAIVLAGVDTPAALSWGRARGIGCMHGRFVRPHLGAG